MQIVIAEILETMHCIVAGSMCLPSFTLTK